MLDDRLLRLALLHRVLGRQAIGSNRHDAVGALDRTGVILVEENQRFLLVLGISELEDLRAHVSHEQDLGLALFLILGILLGVDHSLALARARARVLVAAIVAMVVAGGTFVWKHIFFQSPAHRFLPAHRDHLCLMDFCVARSNETQSACTVGTVSQNLNPGQSAGSRGKAKTA